MPPSQTAAPAADAGATPEPSLARSVALSVVIPVYNEANTIREALRRVRALAPSLGRLEIIAVDDASTDDSAALLAGEQDVVVLRHETNQGKGMAIRTALGAVTGDIVAIQDADLEYDPRDLLRLLEPIARGDASVVYGSRFLAGRPRMRFPNYVCNRLLALTANILYGAHLTDEATCYKLFRADLVRSIPLTCRRFEFCPEVTAKVRRRGERIAELPISYDPRDYDSGKHIRPWDAVVAFWTLLKFRFVD